jgi:hypothetical protein
MIFFSKKQGSLLNVIEYSSNKEVIIDYNLMITLQLE